MGRIKEVVNGFGYGFRYDSCVNTNSDMILVWALSSFRFFGLFLFQAVFRLNFQHASMETSKKITKVVMFVLVRLISETYLQPYPKLCRHHIKTKPNI